uniref:H-NS histone family protein n=1 Tax=Candidatus Kentrum sp. TC TaxID=2126339 RepID=A0A450Z8T9_9GAMM|nr:MAG: H-NS histone family protein [Candidatus Kentron sp. TC]
MRYQDPNEPNRKWSGKGRKPWWVQDALRAGKTLESLQIPDDSQQDLPFDIDDDGKDSINEEKDE